MEWKETTPDIPPIAPLIKDRNNGDEHIDLYMDGNFTEPPAQSGETQYSP
jgi:hypothetical protein